MNPSTRLLAWIFAACCMGACGGGGLIDGGQSGTGISAIRGNVVGITGGSRDLANIRVSLATAALSTQTDAHGRFELRGDASGPDELRFERASDGLFASTEVVIPAGGVLDLEQIVLDSENGEAHPGRELVEFQGIVQTLDCAGGTIVLVSEDDDPQATPFTVDVASATIRDRDGVISCGNLRLGDQLQVRGETVDGSTLINATLLLEDDDSQPGTEVEFQGTLQELDCTGGSLVVLPDDDDPNAMPFTIEVASATIRRDDVVISCADLSLGDRMQVHGETSDGMFVFNATIELESAETQMVELEGVVQTLDCAGGAIILAPKDDDPRAISFTVVVASATIRDGDRLLACSDLRVGDQLQVRGETTDGVTLTNADLQLETG